jgi:hypothetical protein
MRKIVFLSALAFVCAPSDVRAFETKQTPSGAAIRWHVTHATWQLDPSLDQVKGGAQAFRDAAAAWSGKSGAPQITVSNSTVPHAPAFDGVNGIYYVPGGYAPAGNALAITIVHAQDATGEIVDCDIVLNGKYDLEAIAKGEDGGDAPAENEHDATPGRTYDVARVAAHEMGHALGLADEPSEPNALMYPFVSPDRALDASPQEDDLAGIGSLYRTSSQPVTTSKRLRGCAAAPGERGNVTIVLALALAIIVARRRFTRT